MATDAIVLDPAKRARLLTALYIAQEQEGYLSPQALERVAERLDVPEAEVFSTASFYTLFHTQPVGQYLIQVVCCSGSIFPERGGNPIQIMDGPLQFILVSGD